MKVEDLSYNLNQLDDNTWQVYGQVIGFIIRKKTEMDGVFYHISIKFIYKRVLHNVVTHSQDATLRSIEDCKEYIAKAIKESNMY